MARDSFPVRIMDLLWGSSLDDESVTANDAAVVGYLVGGLVVSWLGYLLLPLLRELLYYSPITFRAAAVSALTAFATTAVTIRWMRPATARAAWPSEDLDEVSEAWEAPPTLLYQDPYRRELEASAEAVLRAEQRHAENQFDAWRVGLEARELWTAGEDDWQDLEAWIEKGHALLSGWRRKLDLAASVPGRRLISAMEDKLEAAADIRKPVRLSGGHGEAVEELDEVRARRD